MARLRMENKLWSKVTRKSITRAIESVDLAGITFADTHWQSHRSTQQLEVLALPLELRDLKEVNSHERLGVGVFTESGKRRLLR